MESFLEQIDLHSILPLVAAVCLGGIVGLEREIHHKAAGLRTNILICLGAAAFMVIAGRIYASPDAISRITSGIVTGVGFIGAGVVLRDRANVYGVTTAATIWVVTSIGIACGMHLYIIAIAVTLLSVLILGALSPLDRKIHNPQSKHSSGDPEQ